MLKGRFARFFVPGDYRLNVEAITPRELLARGIKGLIIDLDNTIVIWNDNFLSDGVREWVASLKAAGIGVCIASNSSNIERVRAIAAELCIPMLCRSAKPMKRSFVKAMEILGTGVENTAVVGDQLFTDVFGGNRLGLHTVLVLPLSRKDFIGTRLVRIIEKRILKHLPAVKLYVED